MIEPLNWEFRRSREENPFRSGSSLPLKVTLHTSSLNGLGSEQRAAVELIRELAPEGQIDIVETQPSARRYLKLDAAPKPGHDHIGLTIWENGEARLFSGVNYPNQELDAARSVTGVSDPSDIKVQEALADLLVAAAHRALDRDLLITESPWILSTKFRNTAKYSNARSLQDALKIIGLFLRGRGDYRFRSERRSWRDFISFDRSLFFWILTRRRTPSMWRYFSACVAFGETEGGEVQAMGSAVLTRTKHALQALDAIGAAFYAPDHDSARDATEYHFDYLALLLVGALDAQARIAHRVYRLPGHNRISFRQSKYVNQLREHGAIELFELLSHHETKAFLTLLFEVRNTIHSASLGNHGHHTTGRGPGWLEIQDGEFGQKLFEAASILGVPESWGMTKFRFRKGSEAAPIQEVIRLVPYSYADQLTERGIVLINRIAQATDVSRLFDGAEIPELLDHPPEDHIFNSDIMTRIGFLGGMLKD